MSSLVYLLATRNRGKLRELRHLFRAHRIDVVDLAEAGVPEMPDEEAIEAWETFEENALAKAQYFHQRTGLPTFADDSGLAVEVLGGRPGVRSKRWSGMTQLSGRQLDVANNEALLAELGRRGALPARAEYVCAAAYADEGSTLVRTASTAGAIVEAASGQNGFGYDPHFRSDELGLTFGDASIQEKERISHRGRAFEALLGAVVQA